MRLAESKYSSEITNARISSSSNSVSLAKELSSKDSGEISTRNSRAVIRTINTILKLCMDLPESERTDTCVFQYLRKAVQNVEFAKTAEVTSLSHKHTTSEKLNLSILTAIQLEYSFEPKTRRSGIYFSNEESDNDTNFDEKIEDLFDQYFLDHHFDQRNRKRSLKCVDNKKLHGMKNNFMMKFFECG